MSARGIAAACQHGTEDAALHLHCGAEWCNACDPAPAALCHVCHGRGYSLAEWSAPYSARTCEECGADAGEECRPHCTARETETN